MAGFLPLPLRAISSSDKSSLIAGLGRMPQQGFSTVLIGKTQFSAHCVPLCKILAGS